MDLQQYLEKKKEQQRELAALENERRYYCYKCHRPSKYCLCEHVVPFDTDIRFVILMHPMEARRERVGTGRITDACMSNCEIIVGVNFTEDNKVNELIDNPAYYPMVMYPGDSAINISEGDFSYSDIGGRTPLVFVIDGTWPCAKKMMTQSENLHNIPRICFTPKVQSQFDIKHQPHEMCLSTIEAVHFFLSEWERQGLQKFDRKHNVLVDIFKVLVDFQKACAQDPDKKSYRKSSYKENHERVPSKKWDKRKLFFD